MSTPPKTIPLRAEAVGSVPAAVPVNPIAPPSAARYKPHASGAAKPSKSMKTPSKTTRLILAASVAALCALTVTPARAGLSFVQNFGSFGSGSGQFSNPFGVSVDSAGNVYVANFSNNRIDRFNPANFAGTFTTFGSSGTGSGQFNHPFGLTLDSAGNVYVADFGNNRIDSFNPADLAGTFTSFGSSGTGSGQFNQPTGVTVDSTGNVYVADNGNSRIVELTGAAAAPEPASAALLLCGGALLGLRRRR